MVRSPLLAFQVQKCRQRNRHHTRGDWQVRPISDVRKSIASLRRFSDGTRARFGEQCDVGNAQGFDSPKRLNFRAISMWGNCGAWRKSTRQPIPARPWYSLGDAIENSRLRSRAGRVSRPGKQSRSRPAVPLTSALSRSAFTLSSASESISLNLGLAETNARTAGITRRCG
jgi:hypothetical protein